MRLSALIRSADGALVPVGLLAADPHVAAVVTTDLLHPGRYLSGGELVLTGLAWWRRDEPNRSRTFVAGLVRAGAVALAAGDAQLGCVPAELVDACAEASLPLLRVPLAYSFATITDRAARQLSGRAGGSDLVAVLARHRAVIAAVAARESGGSGLDAVLGLVAADLDLRCWVLSPSGRTLAAGPALDRPAVEGRASDRLTSVRPDLGSPAPNRPARDRLAPDRVAPDRPGPEHADDRLPPLAETQRRELAREFLRARLLPARVRRRDGGCMSLLAVPPPNPQLGPDGLSPSAARAAGWILAVAEDHEAWTPQRQAVLNELASLVGLEAELARRRPDTAGRLVTALAGSSAADVDRFGPPAGIDPTRPAVVVLAQGSLAEVVLTEAFADAVCALGEVDGAVVAVVQGGGDVVERLRHMYDTLAPGFGPDGWPGSIQRPHPGWPRFGVSDEVTGGAGLLGALAEARAVALTADAGTPVAGPDRLSSHALLLAAVPADLREAYRVRVLGPLLEHDRRHRTDLVRTLRMYLQSSGSWSRCAAQMHVHVNTLRYRIERISALTGRDLRRLEDQADLLLALNLPTPP